RRPDSGVEAADIARGPVDVARVADHDVATLAREEGVGVDTAEHDVVARAGRDRVGAADERFDGLDQAEGDRPGREAVQVARGGGHLAVITEDQVVAVASLDDVAVGRGSNHGATLY